MRTKEANALFGDVGELQQADHLKAVESISSRILEADVWPKSYPPLSVRIL